MKIFSALVLLSLNFILGQHTDFRTGIFLHHSTGERIWGPNGSSTSIPLEIDKFNDSLALSGDSSFAIEETSWPLDPWDNEWYRWHRIFDQQDSTADITPFIEDYDIIIIKSCFPSSSIASRGSAQDTLTYERKSIYNYKWHWRSFIRKMEKLNNKFFTVWTNAPLVDSVTSDKSAALSDEFCRWAKDTLALGLDSVYGAFPKNVFVFDFFHKLAGPDGKLPIEYASGYTNSHPNSAATELVAPLFVKEILGAALQYRKMWEISLPILRSPSDSAQEISLTPLLVWNSDSNATYYNCMISSDKIFNDILISVDSISQSDFLVPRGILKKKTTYFWRVKAKNELTESSWSDVWSFTTLDVPQNPILIAPQNNSELPDTTSDVEFIWSTISSADTYTIEASTSEDFDSLLISKNDITDTTYKYSSGLLPGVFYWRVKGINQAGSGDWSETFTISIISYTGLEDKIIPQKFALMQNYPNPFNPNTTIKYAIPNYIFQTGVGTTQRAVSTKLIIYDILGHEITTLVNKQQSPGNYEVVFNATNLPSGIYFYRLHAGKFNAVKKMILMK